MAYAKAMRGALSGTDICLPDNSLNHEYFNAKKGFYWSEEHDFKLADAIFQYGIDWNKIAQETFAGNKTEVEVEMRACLIYRVKDASAIPAIL